MKLFGRKKQGSAREVLLVDIGNGSVAAGIAILGGPTSTAGGKGGSKPVLKSAFRQTFAPMSVPSYENLSIEMHKNLAEVLAAVLASRNSSTLPDDALCFLGSPWAVSEARAVEYARKGEFKVTRDLLRDIRLSAEAEAERGLEDDVVEGVNDRSVIFTEFSRTRLNGYSTNVPEGKAARTVEISGFVGLSSKATRKMIRGEIERQFPHIRTAFVPAPFAYYRGVEEIVIAPPDYLFFDIRSEVTDVLIVRSEDLMYSGSFPFGVRTAERLIANDPREGMHQLKLYYDGKLEDSAEKALEEKLENIQAEWNAYIDEFSRDASAHGAIPTTMLYASEPEASMFVKDIVAQKFSRGRSKMRTSVHLFDLPLKEAVECKAMFDPFLVLGSLFAKSRL